MLLEDENKLIGILVGYVNGVYGEINDNFDFIIKALKTLKNKGNLENYITALDAIKDKALPNCKNCASPCGRTTNYDINALDEDIRNEKIKEVNELLNKLDDISKDELVLLISKLSW